ncbi:MAG: 3-deoxy-manno-octulosonate cytidylyltransferase [Thermoplasmata archaeon]|nr:3-deoxy-manno-octulosonate cytidylyltransferase [Thermoplasmata archaeon]
MKVTAVIPARYGSSRFPGKPLADICGKPMIWWVHESVKKSKLIDSVYVACDDQRIVEMCSKLNIRSVMTSEKCSTHLDRLYEFSTIVDSDFYINVNGDEPLIETSCINDLVPNPDEDPNQFYAANGMMILNDPIDAIDTSKIKIAVDTLGYGMYMSRTPIPYPKSNSEYKLKKFVGVQCFSKTALKFVHDTPRGPIESIEDIDEYRFLENGRKLKFIMTNATTLSVDTTKDLQKVRNIISSRLNGGL